ncbi:hypothetical protein CVP04_04370 [Caviibacterium pharyngocola]|uniref:Uncharacterized protein n=1 Tax=Caviibacterium pharyngocola TaxID=28159 RepID=A0A2M8RWV5_9PAST|nr:hypothetical protein CVP04_04370 [Caviibacterium pharyngocola]
MKPFQYVSTHGEIHSLLPLWEKDRFLFRSETKIRMRGILRSKITFCNDDKLLPLIRPAGTFSHKGRRKMMINGYKGLSSV